jgi:hypothetical protein
MLYLLTMLTVLPKQELAMRAFKPVPEELWPLQPMAMWYAIKPVLLELWPRQFWAVSAASPKPPLLEP